MHGQQDPDQSQAGASPSSSSGHPGAPYAPSAGQPVQYGMVYMPMPMMPYGHASQPQPAQFASGAVLQGTGRSPVPLDQVQDLARAADDIPKPQFPGKRPAVDSYPLKLNDQTRQILIYYSEFFPAQKVPSDDERIQFGELLLEPSAYKAWAVFRWVWKHTRGEPYNLNITPILEQKTNPVLDRGGYLPFNKFKLLIDTIRGIFTEAVCSTEKQQGRLRKGIKINEGFEVFPLILSLCIHGVFNANKIEDPIKRLTQLEKVRQFMDKIVSVVEVEQLFESFWGSYKEQGLKIFEIKTMLDRFVMQQHAFIKDEERMHRLRLVVKDMGNLTMFLATVDDLRFKTMCNLPVESSFLDRVAEAQITFNRAQTQVTCGLDEFTSYDEFQDVVLKGPCLSAGTVRLLEQDKRILTSPAIYMQVCEEFLKPRQIEKNLKALSALGGDHPEKDTLIQSLLRFVPDITDEAVLQAYVDEQLAKSDIGHLFGDTLNDIILSSKFLRSRHELEGCCNYLRVIEFLTKNFIEPEVAQHGQDSKGLNRRIFQAIGPRGVHATSRAFRALQDYLNEWHGLLVSFPVLEKKFPMLCRNIRMVPRNYIQGIAWEVKESYAQFSACVSNDSILSDVLRSVERVNIAQKVCAVLLNDPEAVQDEGMRRIYYAFMARNAQIVSFENAKRITAAASKIRQDQLRGQQQAAIAAGARPTQASGQLLLTGKEEDSVPVTQPAAKTVFQMIVDANSGGEELREVQLTDAMRSCLFTYYMNLQLRDSALPENALQVVDRVMQAHSEIFETIFSKYLERLQSDPSITENIKKIIYFHLKSFAEILNKPLSCLEPITISQVEIILGQALALEVPGRLLGGGHNPRGGYTSAMFSRSSPAGPQPPPGSGKGDHSEFKY